MSHTPSPKQGFDRPGAMAGVPKAMSDGQKVSVLRAMRMIRDGMTDSVNMSALRGTKVHELSPEVIDSVKASPAANTPIRPELPGSKL